MLEEVNSDTLTEVGGADEAVGVRFLKGERRDRDLSEYIATNQQSL